MLFRSSNPMLGHRGCRLAVTYPEICRMQARTIFEAATAIAAKGDAAPVPEIMIPLAATGRELEICKAVIDAEAEAVAGETGIRIEYLVGTMVELPRAAVCAGDLAQQAEFFSFGTNDLTQTALGISRDIIGKRHHRAPAIGADIGAKAGHLKGRAADHNGHCAMVNPGGDGP